jgi:hypothetical protein
MEEIVYVSKIVLYSEMKSVIFKSIIGSTVIKPLVPFVWACAAKASVELYWKPSGLNR